MLEMLCRPSLKGHQESGKFKSASKTSYQPLTPVSERVVTEQAITPTVDPSLFWISIPRGHPPGVVDCPVEGCPFKVKVDAISKRGGQMRNHFRVCHVRDNVCIEEKGQLPCCTRCGFFMRDANSAGAGHHNSVSSWCRKFTIVREKEVWGERQQVGALEVNFTIGGVEIESVKQFSYLGQVLDENNDDSHAAGCPRLMGYFYKKAVVQAVQLW